ncbi:MAG: hypothetical protein COY66_06310 [Candidatus Kerfeldbacteria bacterium CG_4_10_14_0_8_um_filter_42_10]|uniref:Uncharacterized protein n=1 Tax=Candidatus Kerfeldbacteria bacterium CG_4_10_14_0_8_um_filter_42_10 TaxID=2014248 RepID=A0A2M7RGC9_9BACT|nr:MAG: hypothetical protein COY66_06310 [Candidatus Kerfeldbacteria bacterium CG_4_10_14_0_8_um_filter_42_10]
MGRNGDNKTIEVCSLGLGQRENYPLADEQNLLLVFDVSTIPFPKEQFSRTDGSDGNALLWLHRWSCEKGCTSFMHYRAIIQDYVLCALMTNEKKKTLIVCFVGEDGRYASVAAACLIGNWIKSFFPQLKYKVKVIVRHLGLEKEEAMALAETA